ncbi:MAG: DUF6660 family protein [Bacteroidota bacterium]
MKKTSTILGIYMLILAVLPCADEALWCVFDIEETIGIELHQDEEHEHENECSDHCSPLCTCSCCQITVRNPLKAEISINPPYFIFSDPAFREPSFSGLLLFKAIWQPPKLG